MSRWNLGTVARRRLPGQPGLALGNRTGRDDRTFAEMGRPFEPPQRLATPPADLVTMGAHSYDPPHVEWFWGDTGRLRVGRYCSIQSTVTVFVGGEHRPDWVTTFALREAFGLPGCYESGLPHSRGDVILENDVYVGYESLILSGVSIGDGALVAARSVVNRDVPAYACVAGAPARVVRYRFDEPTREALLRIRWWDWPDDKVLAAVDELSSPDVSRFVQKYDPGPDTGD
jgi:acetyltransferase-like isoleucine patch superfamily enzyme